jgi:hypothetical protein
LVKVPVSYWSSLVIDDATRATPAWDTSKVTADEWWTMSCARTLLYWNCDRKTAGEHVWNVQWRGGISELREKNEIYFLRGGKIKKGQSNQIVCLFFPFGFGFGTSLLSVLAAGYTCRAATSRPTTTTKKVETAPLRSSLIAQ